MEVGLGGATCQEAGAIGCWECGGAAADDRGDHHSSDLCALRCMWEMVMPMYVATFGGTNCGWGVLPCVGGASL